MQPSDLNTAATEWQNDLNRIQVQSAALAQKDQRIAALEAEVARLTQELEDCQGQTPPPDPQPEPVLALVHGCYAGPANVAGWTKFAADTKTTGKATTAVDFLDARYGWDQIASPNWLLDPWMNWLKADAKRVLILSVPLCLNSTPRAWDDLQADAAVRALCTNIKNRGIDGQVILRFNWEMNGTWFPWSAPAQGSGETWTAYQARIQSTATGYKRQWRRIVGVVRSISSKFRFCWNHNGGSPNAELWFPGADVLDLATLDIYDVWWQHPGGDPTQRWNRLVPMLQAAEDLAAKYGKPCGVDEWGLWALSDAQQGGGGDNPLYITNMIGRGKAKGYHHLTYFNSSAGGVGTTLQANPKGLAAYQAAYA